MRASLITTTRCLLCLTALLLPGCDGGSATPIRGSAGDAASAAGVPVDAHAAAAAEDPRAGWPPVVRVGLVPTEGGADTRRRFQPLADQLHEKLGVPVDLVSASDYQGVVTAMSNDQLEFAWFGPKSYVAAADRADAEALLVELNMEGEPGYHAIFLVPADSPIQDLADARGQRFAFTDPNSTSGYLIPATVVFDETGLPAEQYFGEVRFSGAHGTSVLQVAAGEIDIIATNDLDLAKMVQKGAVSPHAVREVFRSEMIPGAPLAARREVPASLKQAFIDAVMELNDRPEVLEQFQNGGYRPVTDAAYDMIRATQRFLDAQRAGAAS